MISANPSISGRGTMATSGPANAIVTPQPPSASLQESILRVDLINSAVNNILLGELTSFGPLGIFVRGLINNVQLRDVYHHSYIHDILVS